MAHSKQSPSEWGIVLLIAATIGVLVVIAAIDAVADGVKRLLIEGGVPQSVAGEVGAIIFGGIILAFAWLLLKAFLGRL